MRSAAFLYSGRRQWRTRTLRAMNRNSASEFVRYHTRQLSVRLLENRPRQIVKKRVGVTGKFARLELFKRPRQLAAGSLFY